MTPSCELNWPRRTRGLKQAGGELMDRIASRFDKKNEHAYRSASLIQSNGTFTFLLRHVTTMESSFPQTGSSQLWKKAVSFATTVAVLGWSGCSSVAPSPAAKSAAVGTAIGAGTGAIVGNNSSMGSTTGILGGAALGALAGGIVGMVQEAKDRKEQDRLSQERAYQQERAKRLSEDAKAKAAQDEELAIAQGFRISDMELNEAQKKTDETTERLKKLRDERAAAIARKKSLDELHEKQLSNEAEAAKLEEELARLKGEDPSGKAGSQDVNGKISGSPTAPASPPPAPAAAKPGM